VKEKASACCVRNHSGGGTRGVGRGLPARMASRLAKRQRFAELFVAALSSLGANRYYGRHGIST
jgi:hypothetical protein